MKRTSIWDVAKEAGFSITTVSHALNGYSDVSEKTKQRIKEAVKKLHYAPDVNARSLGGKAETTIALLVSDLKPKDESGLAFGVISGLYNSCIDNGYEFILLATSPEKQAQMGFLQLCRHKNVDGVVVMGLQTIDPYYDEIIESEIPCVLIDVNLSGQNICNVSIDNVDASCKAVDFLFELGHKNIGMINGKKVAAVSNERFSGYARSFLDHNMILDMDCVVSTDFSKENSYKKTVELLRRHPEITALFCASDLIAIGALEAVELFGKKVPQDIAVIGFDDIPLASYLFGGITTIRQDPYKIGRLAGNSICNMLNSNIFEHKVTASYELIVRNTAHP